jgi:hypothetical protein
VEGGPERVVALELDAREVLDVALHGPDPAFWETMTGDGLALDQRLREVDLGGVGSLGERWCGAFRAPCRDRRSCGPP